MFGNKKEAADNGSQDTTDHMPTNVNASADVNPSNNEAAPRYSQSSPDLRAEAHAALIEKRKEVTKDSRSGSYNATNIYVDKMRYGELDRDDSDVDEALNHELADKTPNTKRRIIKEDAQEKTGRIGPFYTAFSVFKGSVGTGILYMPKDFVNGGYVFSPFALLLGLILTMYCVKLLILSRDKLGRKSTSFSQLGEMTLGWKGKIAVDLSLAVS